MLPLLHKDEVLNMQMAAWGGVLLFPSPRPQALKAPHGLSEFSASSVTPGCTDTSNSGRRASGAPDVLHF